MKKTICLITLIICFIGNVLADEPFCKTIVNKEHDVVMKIDLYNNLIIPGQELFGEVGGYLYYRKDGRVWIITNAEINGNIATLTITNDYGSEDLTATLTAENDGTYTLRQEKGSTIKIAVNKKWVKLPSKITFTPEN